MDMPVWMPVAIYAILLLLYLLFYSWYHMDDSVGRRPFVMLLFLTIAILASDFYGRFEGTPGIPLPTIVGSTVINFVLLPAVGVEWHQFIRNLLPANERARMRYVTMLSNFAAGIGIVVSMLSPITSWVFYYDASGIYHRGDLFLVPAMTTLFIFLVTDIYLFTQVKSLERYSLRMLGAYPIPVIIGGLLTFVVSDVAWVPLGFSIATLALFAHIQNTGMGRDYLTGLANRKKLEMLMNERIERSASGYKFAGIMMDIDKFKFINDTLGHTSGDLALADAGHLLQSCVRSGDVVARFGGDEFFILLDIEEGDELREVVERINEEEKTFTREGRDYELRFSKGYDVFDPQKFHSVQDFLAHLDELMYKEKELHHKEAEAQAANNKDFVEERRLWDV
ncbi:MAG: GGDEF domain-containing protein [Eggerthellaceae bacterium]|nr:GGDEF domain-containing protein [Eggerthellaceae bacterium]